ncbi:hypothetical protein [Tardiphaga sp.]|uniref:hypothetical protein n=1 Tax=Tardiphaga sp. TaxID=1926292 RepID=UPI00260863FC|nr:hypothetical protein [Tardiphaga sp.]
MTMPVWPDDLPQRSLIQPFQASVRGNRLSTATDTGPAKQRRRGPAIRPVTCGIMVGMNLRARFDRFYEEEVNFGITPFLIPDQQIDGTGLFDEYGGPLMDESGIPIVIESWWLVQFGQTQPATVAIGGATFTIQFDLVVLP